MLQNESKRREKIAPIILPTRSRNSVVGIATGYGLDDQGFGVR
jgi:hypothetical protein